ncbi:UdgX family uracil-DNA binding protein [Haloferula sp.]|uniref:UdgX family uracil-DNA binding protein n=1 Tax=Haloferula sp. TaxID=2497595 RepID=UPI003C78E65B
MHAVTIEPTFSSWRSVARDLLAARTDPSEIVWHDGSQAFPLFTEARLPPTTNQPPRIPKSFFDLANLVACHRDPDRWSLLYQAAFRMSVGNERHLLQLASEPLVRKLSLLAKSVSRDRHKMKAFVRFRKTGDDPATGREHFVAWFEPEHHIVELTAPFFAKRFVSFDWSILTPDRCVHWNGKALAFSDGVDASQAQQGDELEDYWRTYYANIFNPGRLKLRAMQAEMPKKYWKNLPEASLIAGLKQGASGRIGQMIDQGPNLARAHVSERLPRGADHPESDLEILSPIEALAQAEHLDLTDLKQAANCCRSCQLYESATQTVFGEGNPRAEIMIIGEQPGDIEDITGRPFVGPAGQLLDQALVEIGIKRNDCYLTNTVKHFKWKPGERGKPRLHDKASRDEIHTCKPWLLAEILKVKPRTIILLGSTAAQALIDPDFRLLENRGLVRSILAEKAIATVHPSYILRLPGERARTEALRAFVADLKLALEP